MPVAQIRPTLTISGTLPPRALLAGAACSQDILRLGSPLVCSAAPDHCNDACSGRSRLCL
jgi:hypothetical protein